MAKKRTRGRPAIGQAPTVRFRARPELIEFWQAAAEQAGLDWSAFCRQSLELGVQQLGRGRALPADPMRPQSQEDAT